jgi:hypothetical protein
MEGSTMSERAWLVLTIVLAVVLAGTAGIHAEVDTNTQAEARQVQARARAQAAASKSPR